MSNMIVDLHPRSKSAFSFDVRSAGLVSVNIRWGGGAKLSGFLFGPNSKVAYARKTGTSPLTLSTTATQAMVAKQSMWVVQVHNPSDAPVRATLSVRSPSDAVVRSLARHDQDLQQPRAVALFAHLLTRYVNNAPIKSKADRALKEALDKVPNSRNVLNRVVSVWRAIPATRRQAIFGSEFGDLSVNTVVPEEKLTRNFQKVTDVRLVTSTPGIRIRNVARELPSDVLTPSVLSDIPLWKSPGGSLPHTYRIDYAGLYCQKETALDGLSDEDEPYVIFASTDGFKTWSKRSDVYSDVDSGDSRGASPPLLSLFGETGPAPTNDLAIITTIMESDFGDPDHYRQEIHLLVEAARAVALAYGIAVPDFVANLVVDGFNWLLDTDDEQIGTEAVVIKAGAFHALALTAPVSDKGLTYTLASPIHHGNEWWNGAMYNVMYNIRHDPPYDPVQHWSDWELLGGEFQGAPAVASWGDNRLDVFVRGPNNQMMDKWWDGTQWNWWEDLGGEISDAPAAVSRGPNRIDCFARGMDNQLWHKWWDGTQWQDWELLGGEFQGAPAVASWGANRLDIFVRGTNDQLMHKSWDETGWSGWDNLGGEMNQSPAAVSWGPNRIDCFIRGMDNQLWHKWWDGISWSEWEFLGGEFQGAPTAASWGDNRLDVFVRGTDNQLWHKWWDGTVGVNGKTWTGR